MRNLRLYLAQSLALLFGALQFRDVNVGPDIAGEFSPRISRNSALNHPAIFSIRPPEPIEHPERLSRMECGQESIEASLHIVWMHGLDPSCADFLFHVSASEVEPRFVEIVAKGIRSSHPNQHGLCIHHHLEPIPALTYSFFISLSFLH